MLVTRLLQGSMQSLQMVRERYMSAQSAMGGQRLQRRADALRRSTETLNPQGMLAQLEKSERASQQARAQLRAGAEQLDRMAAGLDAAQEIVFKAGSVDAWAPAYREALALAVDAIIGDLLRAANASDGHGVRLFAGLPSRPAPLQADAGGAPDSSLLTQGDFFADLKAVAGLLREGNLVAVREKLPAIMAAFQHLAAMRIDLGTRDAEFGWFAEQIAALRARLSAPPDAPVAGGPEQAVTDVISIQEDYEALVAALAKALAGGPGGY